MNKNFIVGLVSVVFIVCIGFVLVGHLKEKAIEKEKEAFIRKENIAIQNIDFSNVDNASKDIDNILKPKVKNYISSDVFLNKDKYVVDVYVDLKADNGMFGADELVSNLPTILPTLYKNEKIGNVCIWGNAKTDYRGQELEDNFINVAFDRETYNQIKDFKKLIKKYNGIYILENEATSYFMDVRYYLD